ncbi:hypothetical protein N7520_003192 [Penicillium odoratum]|uniref:uncharacterized protein n=1 Tax=Penicillium odoratum TaxID=1167516 RepID=UPI002549BEE9|nr:uncharacterized protein N7520_003192 [Penicillium odoratum]KAJ5772663.1 hypothetical protein N7520_003192 [Penicillium odoratum]
MALQIYSGDPASCVLLVICCLPIIILCYHSQRQIRPKGCRRLGLPPGKSNLHDEFDPKYNSGVSPTDKNGYIPAWRVKALFTYPLKSCGGIELHTSNIVATGLKFDRQFVFAERSADACTVRTLRNAGFQRLALIQPEIWLPDPSARDYHPSLPEVKSQGVMVISYPQPLPKGHLKIFAKIGMAIGILRSRAWFQVPLSPPEDSMSKYPLRPVTIWKDKPLAMDFSDFIPPSLHAYLGFNPSNSPLTFLRASPAHTRHIFRNAPRKETLGFQPNTAFADAYPIHLLSLSSHRDVAARCAYAIPKLSIVRFRANIIIQGPSAFAEDHWKRISIGGVEIHAACRTVRCRLPNVDPVTGARHPAEPDRALKSYRKIDDGDRTNACLGMQLVPTIEEFVMNVGDEVKVLEIGEHRYIKMLAPGEKVEGV